MVRAHLVITDEVRTAWAEMQKHTAECPKCQQASQLAQQGVIAISKAGVEELFCPTGAELLAELGRIGRKAGGFAVND